MFSRAITVSQVRDLQNWAVFWPLSFLGCIFVLKHYRKLATLILCCQEFANTSMNLSENLKSMHPHRRVAFSGGDTLGFDVCSGATIYSMIQKVISRCIVLSTHFVVRIRESIIRSKNQLFKFRLGYLFH